MISPCPKCSGLGVVETAMCARCGGSGGIVTVRSGAELQAFSQGLNEGIAEMLRRRRGDDFE